MPTIQLLAISNDLWFPDGGIDEETLTEKPGTPSLLLCIYAAGDCDTCPWPMISEFDTQADLRYQLARALFDERETNPRFPLGAVIELPDGEVFDFDQVLIEHEASRRAAA
jgi:hypothetical protein